MTEALGGVVAALAAVVLVVIRTLWRLAERVSRLEGRLNGTRERPPD